MSGIKLTAKQKKFCHEYLKDLNATQAAIRAGYSEDTAAEIGYENLRKPQIKIFIDKQLEEVMEESKSVLKLRIIKELKDVSFTDTGIELLKDKNGHVYDVRINDKLKAIDMLGKYLAMWTENKNIKLDVDESVLEKLQQLYDNK